MVLWWLLQYVLYGGCYNMVLYDRCYNMATVDYAGVARQIPPWSTWKDPNGCPHHSTTILHSELCADSTKNVSTTLCTEIDLNTLAIRSASSSTTMCTWLCSLWTLALQKAPSRKDLSITMFQAHFLMLPSSRSNNIRILNKEQPCKNP